MKTIQERVAEKVEEFDSKFIHYSDFGHSFNSTIKPNGDCEIKDWLTQTLTEIEAEYAKELKIADDRWKGNEQYRERYMQAYTEGVLEGKAECAKEKEELVREILALKSPWGNTTQATSGFIYFWTKVKEIAEKHNIQL